MVSTINFITSILDVPREWIFEHYLNLTCRLSGQTVKLKSVFNLSEKTESMYIYFDETKNYYRFKDFSSGNQGNCWNLVQHLYNLSFGEAAAKIINDYQVYTKNNTVSEKRELVIHDKFKVVDYEMRHWNTLDQQYWMMFKISSGQLDRYNVVPLEFFTMEKEEIDSTMTSFTFKRPYMYGYFRNDGSLYKIYMPKNTDKKFIKVENYIQGTEQLKYDCKYLIITSSLKDLMCFNKLGISNVEAIAPDSENTMIGEKSIGELKLKYHKIIVLFDNDEPGIKAAERYKIKYGLNHIHGIEKVREVLFPLLKQVL